MHRSVVSRSIVLGRVLGLTSASSLSTAALARPSSLRRCVLSARPLSSSPSLWTTKDETSPISHTPTPSMSAPKEGESELEPELESVPLPSSLDSVDPTSEAVGSPSMGDILEEIGSEVRVETPEEVDPPVTEEGSVASELPLVSLQPEAASSETSTAASHLTPPVKLNSGRMIINVVDFDRKEAINGEKYNSNLVDFIAAPPSTEYTIVDPEPDDLVPPINYFALWPQIDSSTMAKSILTDLLDNPPPIPPLPAHLQTPAVPKSRVNDDLASPSSSSPSPPSHPLLHQTLKWLTTTEVRRNPHITIMHENICAGHPPDHPYSLIWDRFSFLSLQPFSPEYLIRFDNLVWDRHVIILTVDSISLILKDGMDEEYVGLWTLPPTMDKRFHLTVVRDRNVATGAPAELLRRFRFLEGVREGRVVIGEKERRGMGAWAKVNSVSLVEGEGAVGGPYEARAKFAARALD